MKLAIIGASGWIGSHIAKEAQRRGHALRLLVRDPGKVQSDATVVAFDLSAPDWSALQDVDVVIGAIGGRAQGNHSVVPESAQRLLQELPKLGVKRLVWVGGAGSLLTAEGGSLVESPRFPAEYRDEALAQAQALEIFKASQSPLTWTFISPAAEIFPGETSGQYRVGQEQLLTDSEGRSRISVADYAYALLDEVEQNRYRNQRIGVAY